MRNQILFASLAICTLAVATAVHADDADHKARAKARHPHKSHAPYKARVPDGKVRETTEDTNPDKADYRGVMRRDQGGHFKGIPTLNGQRIEPPKTQTPFGPNASGG